MFPVDNADVGVMCVIGVCILVVVVVVRSRGSTPCNNSGIGADKMPLLSSV